MSKVCLEKGFSIHSSEMKNILTDYLKKRLDNFVDEDFEKYMTKTLRDFVVGTIYKEWKESNCSVHGVYFIRVPLIIIYRCDIKTMIFFSKLRDPTIYYMNNPDDIVFIV